MAAMTSSVPIPLPFSLFCSAAFALVFAIKSLYSFSRSFQALSSGERLLKSSSSSSTSLNFFCPAATAKYKQNRSKTSLGILKNSSASPSQFSQYFLKKQHNKLQKSFGSAKINFNNAYRESNCAFLNHSLSFFSSKIQKVKNV